MSHSSDSPSQLPVNGAIRFAVSRYVLTLGAFVSIVLVGFIATLGLGINLLPTLTIPVVSVTTSYPGGTPADLDRQVTRPLEEAVSTIPGIGSVQSTSAAGVSSVILNFRPGTNVDAALAEVNQKVADARGDFPAGVNAPIAQKFDPNASTVLTVALSATVSLQNLRRYAIDRVKPALEAVPGVASASVSGAPQRRLNVSLDPDKLNTYGLSPSQVSQSIGAASQDLPAGELEGVRGGYTTRSTPSTLEAVGEIRPDPSKGVRIFDLGSVALGEAPRTQIVRLNGQEVVSLDVRKLPGGNTVSVSQGVRAALVTLELPRGYAARAINDNAPYIQHSVDDTLKEGVLVAVAVAIVCLLALGKLNTAFAVILAIPISLAAAPLVFALLGFSINIITLLALIVAMGIVVDDSIVVAENVDRYRAQGLGPVESVLRGASEIFSAVSAATWSLLAVLLPISFLPGIVGQLFREFGLGLAAAIFFSWLEAIFFLTVRMAYTPDPAPLSARAAFGVGANLRSSFDWTLKIIRNPIGWAALGLGAFLLYSSAGWAGLLGVPLLPLAFFVLRHLTVSVLALFNALVTGLHRATERGLERLRVGYEHSLRSSLKRAWLTLTLTALFLGSAAFLAPSFEFTPRTDDNYATVEASLPIGATLEDTNAVALRLEDYLNKAPETETVSSVVGLGTVNLTLELVKKDRRESVFTLTERWQRELTSLLKDRPEVEVRTSSGTGDTGTVPLSFSAPDVETLRQKHSRVLELLRADPQVRSVRSSLSDALPERVFRPDASKLQGTGLTPSELGQTLRGFVEGSRAGDFRDTAQRPAQTLPLFVRLEPGIAQDPQSLLALPIFAPTLNTSLPLSELGKFELLESPTNLVRVNRRYAANLRIGLVAGAGALEVQGRLEGSLTKAGVLSGGVKLESGDANSDAALAGNLSTVGPLALALALILNYLVLGAQFNSFRYPIYLLVPVPLSLVGALWTLELFGLGLDVISTLGMVILIGLATKNAILLLDFVVERAKEKPLLEALIESGGLRLRPILMTTLTVLVISIPLVLGVGEGAELRRGLGIVILGGLISATVLTLYVVPALFYTFERGRLERPTVGKMRRQLELESTG